IDPDLVKRRLNELTSANKRVYRLSEEAIQIPEGEALELEEYFSVQNDFPLVYGIGEFGIPQTPNNQRKGQAKQLKGYLLLFEQIMANYLSQLSHAKDLFSLNANIRQTYFYQSLEKVVPDVKPLLKQEKRQSSDKKGFSEYENFLSYQTGLPELVKMKDNFTDRRNRFLDYLLAIHGEAYTQQSLSQFNYYFEEVEFEKHLIQNKTRFLRSLSFINKNRAKAFNYKKANGRTDNITGLEAKISLLLGLGVGKDNDKDSTVYNPHSILDTYTKYGLKLIKEGTTRFRKKDWEKEAKLKSELLNEVFIDQNFDYVDIEDEDVETCSEDESQFLLQQTLPFRSKMLPEAFLREGLNIEQYKIGEIVGTENSWIVLFKHFKEEEWITIGTFSSYREANLSVQILRIFLRKLNIETEGLHVLEHILLRPDLTDNKYGIFMLSPDGKPLLRSIRLYTFEERKEVIDELKHHISYYEHYSVEATKDKDFEVHFKTSDGKHTFVSVVAKPSVEETHQDMETLYKLMSDQLHVIPYKNKIGLYIRYSEQSDMIPEDFFSYRSSILIPTWSARFENKEFRAIAEDIIEENSPANVSLRIIWLDPDDMEEFEKKYYEWMEVLMKFTPDVIKRDELNTAIAQMLLNFRKENEQ
ncbi:MAG TPA: hypothetical protein VK766_02490, partial [Cytophagaceae bacterium]|nr:hypothetical protein [Cytophagaceae bacterium]